VKAWLDIGVHYLTEFQHDRALGLLNNEERVGAYEESEQ
jgi:hypothetical protein